MKASGLPNDIEESVAEALGELFGAATRIFKISPVHGGCINNAGKLETTHGSFFLKWNSSKNYPGMFKAEAKGLNLLKAARALRVPDVLKILETQHHQAILMDYIEPASPSSSYWEKLGEGLALQHLKNTTEAFGLNHDNYIGSLPQLNEANHSWIGFFINQRLERQLCLLESKGVAGAGTRRKCEKLYKKLPGILNETSPSLLHGDLWSGNIIIDESGLPAIIDPAVYYGTGEVDLAMTTLFGGFDKRFYEAYQTVSRLEPGWETRFDIYNLYPLMVHANLFGGAYLIQAEGILERYA